jgi:transcriptional antiterminator RfaH
MWYAVYTKPKKEDSVAFLLRNIGIKILYPKIRFKKYKKNKFIEVIEPLFPCYLFASFEKEKYSHLIKYTRGVRYVVGKSNPVSVHEEIISAMKQGMEDDNIIAVKPQRFDTGDRVFIKDGPFRDFYGIFERETRGPERAMILLDVLNYRLELDGCFLAVA